jgi:hypothetical protein
MERAFFSKKDVILIASVLAIGFLLLFIRQRGNGPADGTARIYAEITHNGAAHAVYLDEDKTFSLPSAPHVVFEINNERIAFVESDCPDRICIRAGFISLPGQMAACLPNRLVMVILGEDGNADGIDMFTR